jgi:hypothetical protein
MDTSALTYDSPIALLEADYQREGPRNILLVVDWEDRRITAETRDPTTEGCSAYRWHHRETAYPLPPTVDASALRAWVDEHVAPLAERLASFYEKTWDGNNYVGRFPGHEDEREIFDEWMANAAPFPCHDGGLWDIEDWLDGGAFLRADELNATTTDDEINQLAAEIVDNAALENVVIRGEEEQTRKYLRELRQRAIDAAPRRHTYTIEGYEQIEKAVIAQGSTGRIYLPMSWVGCQVAVVRLGEKRAPVNVRPMQRRR